MNRRSPHRPGASGENRDIRSPRQFDQTARIALCDGERQVAGDRDEAKHLQLGRAERQQDGHRVVHPRIGVDDDPPRHRLRPPLVLAEDASTIGKQSARRGLTTSAN